MKWGTFDYSQQEPRLVAHYALKFSLPSVNQIADSYESDPSTDFHKIVAEMAKIPRSQAKTINLGLFYGMGKAKLQGELEYQKKNQKNYLPSIIAKHLLLNIDEQSYESCRGKRTNKNFTW